MRQFIIILTSTLIFTSCKKNEIPNTISDSLNGIYIGGTVRSNLKDIAAIWKDGKLILMSDSLTQDATIESIFVTNSHVYACGFSTNGYTRSAALWEDGVMTYLADTATGSNASSVYATDAGDVYVCGSDIKYGPVNAVVWKNGKETFLTNATTQNSTFYESGATKVFVMNDVCYISGFETTAKKMVAKIWENGSVTNLTDGSNLARANAVFVYGKDTYVAGYEYNNNSLKVAKIWKNKLPISISDTAVIINNNFHPSNDAFDLFVDGQDIYVAGNELNSNGNFMKIWKNGNASIINNIGFDSYSAQSLYVSSKNVYLAGTVGQLNNFNISNKACFWRNGDLYTLPDFSKGSSAKAVFVKN